MNKLLNLFLIGIVSIILMGCGPKVELKFPQLESQYFVQQKFYQTILDSGKNSDDISYFVSYYKLAEMDYIKYIRNYRNWNELEKQQMLFQFRVQLNATEKYKEILSNNE
jgi:hypothetical protein